MRLLDNSNVASVLIAALLSGLIGSILTALINSKLQARAAKRHQIAEIYIDNGIARIRNDLCYYGNLCVFTLDKVNRMIDSNNKDPKCLEAFVQGIRQSEVINRMMAFDYETASASWSILHIMGLEFYDATLYAFYTFSWYLIDILHVERLSTLLSEPLYHSYIASAATLTQRVRMYLESRLHTAELHIRRKEYADFAKIARIKEEKEIRDMRRELQELYLIIREHLSSNVDRRQTSRKLESFLESHPLPAKIQVGAP